MVVTKLVVGLVVGREMRPRSVERVLPPNRPSRLIARLVSVLLLEL